MAHIKLVTEIPGPKSREVLANHERYVARALALGFPAAIREADGALRVRNHSDGGAEFLIELPRVTQPGADDG